MTKIFDIVDYFFFLGIISSLRFQDTSFPAFLPYFFAYSVSFAGSSSVNHFIIGVFQNSILAFFTQHTFLMTAAPIYMLTTSIIF